MPSRGNRSSRRTSGISSHSSTSTSQPPAGPSSSSRSHTSSRYIASSSTPTRPNPADASARPFSPSPPRDTRHTSSRPPSLLFGARPPTASVATSSSFDLSGLPTSRGRDTFGGDGFGALGQGGQAEQQGQQGYFGLEVDVPGGARPGVPMVRNDRYSHSSIRLSPDNDSISTTSSASPPLGATSILSTLAAEDPLILPQPVTRSRPPSYVQAQPVQTRLQGHARDPTPPDAFPAVEHTPSSPSLSLNPSRSMPRLHQPTVIRRTSGRIAFLPNAAGPVSPRMMDEAGRSIGAVSEELGSARQGTRGRQERDERHTAEYAENERERRLVNRHSFASSSSFDSLALSRYDNERTISSVDSSFFSSPSSKVSPLPAVPEPKEEEDQLLHEVIEKEPGYKPPYIVRAKARNRQYPGPSDEPDTATYTIQASISRHPDDGPLPFGAGHLELRLAWLSPEVLAFAWVPGRKYVPAWDVQLVKGQEREGTARWVVKGVVSQLPIVWRLARWL